MKCADCRHEENSLLPTKSQNATSVVAGPFRCHETNRQLFPTDMIASLAPLSVKNLTSLYNASLFNFRYFSDYCPMEAERINSTKNLCEDLLKRLAELRGYL